MDEFLADATAALDLDVEVDQAGLLDLARVVAHTVERRAAPLSTFLAGLAAGKRGGTPDQVAEAVATLLRVARERPTGGG